MSKHPPPSGLHISRRETWGNVYGAHYSSSDDDDAKADDGNGDDNAENDNGDDGDDANNNGDDNVNDKEDGDDEDDDDKDVGGGVINSYKFASSPFSVGMNYTSATAPETPSNTRRRVGNTCHAHGLACTNNDDDANNSDDDDIIPFVLASRFTAGTDLIDRLVFILCETKR